MEDLSDLVGRVWEYYDYHGRHDMPWRHPDDSGNFDPYRIVVSELMLQQTQVARVEPKYELFMSAFPTVGALSNASLEQVLQLWTGLGYNRRAKFLWQTAQMVRDRFHNVFPHQYAELLQLPGVGPNTAGAIQVYAYDVPVVFIETNIRSIYIHHYFHDVDLVSDKELRPVQEASLLIATNDGNPTHTPRTWYWALMDYGSYLKQTVGNSARRSKSYTLQSTFQGSRRQIRGQIIRLLGAARASYLELSVQITDDRLGEILEDLVREGLISHQNNAYRLGST